MDILGKLHDAVFEKDDSTPTPAPAPVPTPTPSPNPNVGVVAPLSSTQLSDEAPGVLDNNLVRQYYSALLAASDISQSSNLQKIFGLAKPLENVVPDPSMRLKIVMAQNSISPTMAVEMVNDLLKFLDLETQKFSASKKAWLDESVNKLADDVKDIQNQIAALQDKLLVCQKELAKNRTAEIDRSRAFISAMSRRKSELEVLKSQFTQLK